MDLQTDAGQTQVNQVLGAVVLGLVLLACLIYWQRGSFAQLARDWRRNRIAYLFVLPSIVCIFAVIIFPFFYNIVLSLSNMSLANFRDWQVIGLQNYREVFSDATIGVVFLKTIVWTVVNVSKPWLSGSVKSRSTTSATRFVSCSNPSARRSAWASSTAACATPASRSISSISRASPGLSSIRSARIGACEPLTLCVAA